VYVQNVINKTSVDRHYKYSAVEKHNSVFMGLTEYWDLGCTYIIIIQLNVIYLHAKANSISADGETADPGVKAIILF